MEFGVEMKSVNSCRWWLVEILISRILWECYQNEIGISIINIQHFANNLQNRRKVLKEKDDSAQVNFPRNGRI